MHSDDFERHYRKTAADQDRVKQAVLVEEYNFWTDMIRETVDSILQRIAVEPPKEFDWIIENDTRKVSWAALNSVSRVNLLPDRRLVVVEVRPFYAPPLTWTGRRKKFEYSQYDKHVVRELKLVHINPETPWQTWNSDWELRKHVCESLVFTNRFNLPASEFNPRYQRLWDYSRKS